MSKPYQVLSPTAPVPAPDDVLEMIVREGARKMLQSALEKEVDDFLFAIAISGRRSIAAIATGTCPSAPSALAWAPWRSVCHA